MAIHQVHALRVKNDRKQPRTRKAAECHENSKRKKDVDAPRQPCWAQLMRLARPGTAPELPSRSLPTTSSERLCPHTPYPGTASQASERAPSTHPSLRAHTYHRTPHRSLPCTLVEALPHPR